MMSEYARSGRMPVATTKNRNKSRYRYTSSRLHRGNSRRPKYAVSITSSTHQKNGRNRLSSAENRSTAAATANKNPTVVKQVSLPEEAQAFPEQNSDNKESNPLTIVYRKTPQQVHPPQRPQPPALPPPPQHQQQQLPTANHQFLGFSQLTDFSGGSNNTGSENSRLELQQQQQQQWAPMTMENAAASHMRHSNQPQMYHQNNSDTGTRRSNNSDGSTSNNNMAATNTINILRGPQQQQVLVTPMQNARLSGPDGASMLMPAPMPRQPPAPQQQQLLHGISNSGAASFRVRKGNALKRALHQTTRARTTAAGSTWASITTTTPKAQTPSRLHSVANVFQQSMTAATPARMIRQLVHSILAEKREAETHDLKEYLQEQRHEITIEIQTATATAVAKVQEEGSECLIEMDSKVKEQLEKIETTTNKGTARVQQAQTEAVAEISTLREKAVETFKQWEARIRGFVDSIPNMTQTVVSQLSSALRDPFGKNNKRKASSSSQTTVESQNDNSIHDNDEGGAANSRPTKRARIAKTTAVNKKSTNAAKLKASVTAESSAKRRKAPSTAAPNQEGTRQTLRRRSPRVIENAAANDEKIAAAKCATTSSGGKTSVDSSKPSSSKIPSTNTVSTPRKKNPTNKTTAPAVKRRGRNPQKGKSLTTTKSVCATPSESVITTVTPLKSTVDVSSNNKKKQNKHETFQKSTSDTSSPFTMKRVSPSLDPTVRGRHRKRNKMAGKAQNFNITPPQANDKVFEY